jgi:SAM-dependent methyltransferase
MTNDMKTKPVDHDQRMTNVYASIYGQHYALSETSVAQSKTTITKNLLELGISLNELADLSVLNVGPAREAFAFQQLGAAEVHHFDISTVAVDALQSRIDAEGLTNLVTRQLDLCTPDGLGLHHRIDLVYLSGVLHHLHDPGLAVRNIIDTLRPHARLFFRVYRSGSFGFFVVDFLRHFVTGAEQDAYIAAAPAVFGTDDKGTMLFEDMIDDFFVPVLHLFDPRQLDSYFSQIGFWSLEQDTFPDCAHGFLGGGGRVGQSDMHLTHGLSGKQPRSSFRNMSINCTRFDTWNPILRPLLN